MSFKVKRWGSLGQINVTDYDAGAQGGAGTDQAWVFSFGGRIVFLCYDSVYDPAYYTYDPSSESWTGPHDATAVGAYWSTHSYLYGDSAEYQVWGAAYIVGYGMPITNWEGGQLFVTIDAAFALTYHDPPASPSGGGAYDQLLHCHAGVGADPSGLPARLCTWFYKIGGVNYCAIYRYGPGGTALLYQGLLAGIAWTTDPVDNQIYWSGVPAGSCVFWSVDSGCPDADVEDEVNLFASPPLVGAECSPLAPIAPIRSFTLIDGVAWGIIVDRTTANPGVQRWSPVSVDVASTESPPWSGTWDMRRLRDGLGYAIDQGDVDGVDHAADLPIEGEPSYNGGLGWYVGSSTSGKAGVSVTAYVLDPWPPAGMTPRPASLGTNAIGWIGECAIRPNLRVEDVLPAGRASPAGLGGSVVERLNGEHLLTPSAIVARTGSALTVGAALSVDVSSYPVTDPDWLWPGSEDGRVETFWTSFAEGPTDTMLWGGMPDTMWGMYQVIGSWVPRWKGLGILGSENLEATGGNPTHVLSTANGVAATYADMQPLPTNYESAPDQLIGWPDFPGGPVVCYFGSATQQSAQPYWQATIWRVLAGTWTEIVDFQTLGPPGLGETDWTVWSVAPIRACRAMPQGGFLVGATLYFAPWATGAWETDVGTRDATFLDTGLGYVPGKPGNEGPLPVEHVPVYLTCEAFSGGRSLYGPDALLVYDHQGNFVTHLNTPDLYPPDGRQILVTREPNPRVIYKIYREGTYSDFAEGWGAYHRFDADAETQTGLYVCYDLMDTRGRIVPGLGTCHGFLDMYALGAAQDSDWRWSVPSTLYDVLHPRDWWSPPGRAQLRMGLGGLSITPLPGGPASCRNGVRGVGSRS